MLCQKLLVGEKPYMIRSSSRIHGFVEHKHPELEFSCCIGGEYRVTVDKREYLLKSGDIAIVGSMVPHGIPDGQDTDCTVMTIEVGPAFLVGSFEPFSKAHFDRPVISLADHPELGAIISELHRLCSRHTVSAELSVRGELYRLCAYVLDNFVIESATPRDLKALDDAARIEKALEYIYNHYGEELTVRYVASQCGYSDSNFCRIFRQITGDTFHATLNKRRCEMACTLLGSTTASVESIAVQVGFADAKSFCRVFGKVMGTSPGAYRRGRSVE